MIVRIASGDQADREHRLAHRERIWGKYASPLFGSFDLCPLRGLLQICTSVLRVSHQRARFVLPW